MARPERNTVDYFPHLIGDGKKIFSIENKYGNDGYATWFKILEKLAITDHHYLDLNSEEEIMYMAAKCRVDEDRLIAIINDLTRLKVFDKKLWELRIIWCPPFIDSIQDAYFRRNNNCMTYEGLCKHLNIKCSTETQESGKKNDNKPQTILKDIKEKEISVFEHAIACFIEMRKKIKKPASERALELVRIELEKLAPNNEALQVQIIEQSIRNSWQDVFPLRGTPTPPKEIIQNGVEVQPLENNEY